MRTIKIHHVLKGLSLAAFFCVMAYTSSQLPAFGDLNTPASLHVSPHYIQKAYKETGSPNLVTAVLADYRSLDTLFETAVILTSALSCLLILGFRKDC